MSASFNVGDRVVCIPFKHKGKVATVRFFGSINKKFGTWVGLELDEPTGECSGDFNGEYLFECAENYGLVLRNTQVKLFDPNEVSVKNLASGPAGKLTLDEKNFGDADDQPAGVSPVNAAQEESKGGWRDKLEKLRAKKVEEKTKTLPEESGFDRLKAASSKKTEDDQNVPGSKEEESAVQKAGGLKKPSINQYSPRNADLPETQTFGEETAKERLEKNRLAAIEKKKELETKQAALAQQRNLRTGNVTTPRSASTTKIGFNAPTTAAIDNSKSSSNLRNASNLKGSVLKPSGASSIAKANAYPSAADEKKTEPAKPDPIKAERPAMTQTIGDRDKGRAPSASRLAGTARGATVLDTKKVPAEKVPAATSGKTPLKQSFTSGGQLNKSLVPGQPKPLASTTAITTGSTTPNLQGVQSSFSTAEIKKLEGQLQEKEDEIQKLNQEIETHKQKIGSMMIKHNGESKRQQEEITLLKKQVESASSNKTDSNASQAQIKAAQALLEEAQEAEKQAQDKISELENQIGQIRQQLSDAKKEANHAQTDAAVKIANYEAEILQMHQRFNDHNQTTSASMSQHYEALMQQKLDETRKELGDQISKQTTQLQDCHRQIDKLRQELKTEQERREEELELLQLEKEALIDEKREILEKYMESAKVEEEDPLQALGMEEIKLQNKKLRNAITTLTFGFEEERKRLEQKMTMQTEKDKIIAEQDARLKEMDLLLEELEQKEKDLQEMGEKFEEIMEYEIMVEEMVQEIANKEGEVEDMQERMIEIEEEHAMFEELVENLEKYNKELQDDIVSKDKVIEGLQQEKEQLETIVIDQDSITNKYKERQAQLTKQMTVLTEQLQITMQSTSAGNAKDQVALLLEKQQVLITKLRDAGKKSLEVTKQQIDANQVKMKAEIVQQMLPESLGEEALLPSLEKIQYLNTTKHKAMLLIRQICETFLENAKNVYEDPDQLSSYINTLLKISLMAHRIIECASFVQFQVANMTPGQYDEITKLLVWLQIKVVSNELDSVLELLLDEAISQNFEASTLEQAIQQMENLRARTEKMFVTISPEELKQQEESGKQEVNPSIEQQRRQNLARVCQKLNYRTAALQMALSIVFLPHLQEKFESPEEKQQMVTKVGLIYSRLMQTILKIDLIDNRVTGEEYFQDSLNSDLRLQQKYDTLKALWDGAPNVKAEAKKKNWMSVVEAVERDITQLMNDYKFKKLTVMIDEKYGERKVDLNDLYAVDFEANGPWRIIAHAIRSDLQDMGVLKQKNTVLVEQHKAVQLQLLQLKKERDENLKIQQTLEKKLGQALGKAEQLNAIEIERDEQAQQIKSLEKKLESEIEDNTATKTALTETKKKLEEVKKTLAERPVAPVQEQQPQQIQNQPRGVGTRRQAKEFFTGLQNNAPKDQAWGNAASTGNATQIIQNATVSEDMYMNIINDLQADRMRMKGRDMTSRLLNLQSSESAFTKLLKQNNESKVQTKPVRLNTEEQSQIDGAVTSVETLKSQFKRQMANARIVDLAKVQATSGTTGMAITPLDIEKAVAEHQKRNTEQFNILVVEARNKMNDALEFLFQKDSKLRNLMAQTTDTAISNHESEAQCEVKVGVLKLRSKIPVPNKKVVLDDATLAQLRKNLQLLTI